MHICSFSPPLLLLLKSSPPCRLSIKCHRPNQVQQLERQLEQQQASSDTQVDRKAYEALREQLQAQELRAAAEQAKLSKELASLQVRKQPRA